MWGSVSIFRILKPLPTNTCLSIVLETINLLDTAVSKAGTDGIVMLCGTHDEGSNVGRAWPASSPSTFAVTTCDEYGTLYRAMKGDSCKYMLLDSADRISGSSMATAMAAGLSSLILSCLRISNPDQDFEGVHRYNLVEAKLNEVLSHSESKYVCLKKFGGSIST